MTVPAPAHSAGCPVLGLFRRASADLVTVHLPGSDAITVTGGHRLFSDSRNDWVEARDVLPGEVLHGLTGPVPVEFVAGGSQESAPVYNLEVSSVHRYFVSDAAVEAHNAGPCGGNAAQAAEEVHGNSNASTKPQHRYEIVETATGDVGKTGISGQPLNANGTSPRANSQVNALNKAAGNNKWSANILEQNIPGRAAAKASEQAATNQLAREGNSLSLHKLPKPQ